MRFLRLLPPAFLLIATIHAGVAGAGPEQEAAKAAEQWLAVVDAGQWSSSWDHAATLFRKAVPKDTWSQQIQSVRSPMGPVVSRTIIGANYTESLPGAPDGRYVVIQYRSEFANKAKAIETVTPAFDGDSWRVSGYYIH